MDHATEVTAQPRTSRRASNRDLAERLRSLLDALRASRQGDLSLAVHLHNDRSDVETAPGRRWRTFAGYGHVPGDMSVISHAEAMHTLPADVSGRGQPLPGVIDAGAPGSAIFTPRSKGPT
jgi:hypothetical protein